MVRPMCRSMSRSYHILMAPDAPAPSAMQRMAKKPVRGLRLPGGLGASKRPVMAVNTTSDITRGFNSTA